MAQPHHLAGEPGPSAVLMTVQFGSWEYSVMSLEAHAELEFLMLCLHLPGAEITGVDHHAWTQLLSLFSSLLLFVLFSSVLRI